MASEPATSKPADEAVQSVPRQRIAILAGEKSGDILGASLIAALKKHFPDAEFIGIGGPLMIAAGCHSLAPMERLSVMGFVEPLGRLPELLRIKRKVEETLLADPPAVFIGIDSPDFNLRIEKRLRAAGIKTVHYVSPSVWAYREKRIHGIKQAVDLMLTLFPFETAVYEQHGIAVRCVGHPLADSIALENDRASFRQQLGLPSDAQVLTLMPGSRSGEIKRLGPTFIGAALEAQQHCPALRFVIPCAGPEARQQIANQLSAANVFSANHFQLVDDSQAAIAAADLVLLASGTATLETMLLRRPMVVCYKLATLTYFLASRMVKIPWVALPNLLAQKQLVPEYLQSAVTVGVLRDEIVEFFAGKKNEDEMLAEFDRLHRLLRRDASSEAAAAIAKLITNPAGITE